MITRKKYSKEFKLDAISLVLNQQYTRAEAARSLEVNPNLLTRWIKEYEQDNDGQAFVVMTSSRQYRKKSVC